MTQPRNRTATLTGVVLILSVTANPSFSHHGNYAYDRAQTVSVTGTVTRWQFINPHVGLWLDVIDEQGNVQSWAGEFTSVQDLYRGFQWNKDTFSPGDTVTLIGSPDRRPEAHAMLAEAVVFADGTRVDVR